MEEAMLRSRYARHITPDRRRKRTVRENGRLSRLIARQLLLSLVLLLVAVLAKNVKTPVTNFVSEKIRFTLEENIEVKSIYDYADKAVANLKNSIAPPATDFSQEGEDGEQAGPTVNEGAAGNGETMAADTPASSALTSEPETSVLSASFESEPQAAPGMQTPVSGVLSSPWGERTDPLTGKVKFHEGIDIESDNGAGIKAALDGTVEEAGSSPSYGNYVKLGHDGGYETIYAHCSLLNVKKGAAVKQGEVIAKIGDTGSAVGIHLHFEVLKDGIPVNPLNYINLGVQ